jgi:hypothetical protein
MWGRSSVGRALEWHSSVSFFCFQSSGEAYKIYIFKKILDKRNRLIYNLFGDNKAVKFKPLD